MAKHGGIVAAVRNMPYAIQQPAVSGQIARLEKSLGTKLFNRRPFALSLAGRELFAFIQPFFENVEHVAEAIRGGYAQPLRLAAPAIVLHDYLPEILQRLRKRFPQLRLFLHEAARPEAERLLSAGEVDVAITASESKSAVNWRALLELPLVLLANKKRTIKRAEELWHRDKIEETLITFPRNDPIFALFQRGLQAAGAEWFPGIEVNSARLIECYVAHDYGIGLTVATPRFKLPKKIRMIRLPDFPRITIGVAWGNNLPAIAQQLLAELCAEAAELRHL